MLKFEVDVDDLGETSVVRVSGDIDIYSCPRLNRVLSQFAEKDGCSVVLDLSRVHYIDSTGLGVIAHTARSLDKTQGTVLIISQVPQVRKIFEVSGLSKKNIRLFENEQAAIDALEE